MSPITVLIATGIGMFCWGALAGVAFRPDGPVLLQTILLLISALIVCACLLVDQGRRAVDERLPRKEGYT